MTPRVLGGRGRGTGAPSRSRSRAAALLLAALLPLTAWLWAALVYLLQLEARNRLAGSPGESSPLSLALLGLPVVALVSASCLAAGLALRSGRPVADVRRALVAAAALVLVAALALVVLPRYRGAVSELVLLPWRVLTS